MQRVKARRSFEHFGSVKRGDILTDLTQQHAEALSRKGLVVILNASGEQEAPPADDPATTGGPPAGTQSTSEPTGGAAPPAGPAAFDPALLERNAPEIVEWAEQAGDREQLQAALTAERGGKARKGVLAALEKALGG